MVAPSLGDYETCLLEAWRKTSDEAYSVNMPGVPIDLDGWTYYNLPVLGQSAYLFGDRKKQTLASD